MKFPSLSKQRLLLFLIAGAGIATTALLLVPRSPQMLRGQAQNPPPITDYSMPTANSMPLFIIVGPDNALWFTEMGASKIGRINPTTGTMTEFIIPSGVAPLAIATGPDGNLWFTEWGGSNKIGKITTAGTITEFPAGGNPHTIVTGPDGNLWFTEYSANKIGMITPTGNVTEFNVPSPDSGPHTITAGPDGNLWFTEWDGNKIGNITTAGTITEYVNPTPNSGLLGLVTGPDGNLWFTEMQSNKIGKITTAGTITEYPLPEGGGPYYIVPGPDGKLWFTEYAGNKIGRIDPSTGAITEDTIGTPVSGEPKGLTFGPDGKLWIADWKGNNIRKTTVSLAPPAPAALVARYSFDVSTTWKDVSPNGGHDVTNYGATPVNGCMDFNGTTSYLKSENSAGLPAGNSPRTIAYWFNARTYAQQGMPFSLGLRGWPTAQQRFITGPSRAEAPYSPGNYIFTDGVNGGNNFVGQLPTSNAWHHFAFTYDGNQGWKYYYDGILAQAGTFPVTIDTYTDGLEIGARHDAPGFFDGLLDDVRVYTGVLTAQQIQTLYQSKPSCEAPVSSCGNGTREGAEQCDGGGCCNADCTFKANATVCRASVGVCDIAESCTGAAALCPADTVAPSATLCRPAVGVCDSAESCSGTSSACPVDTYASSITTCRPSAGVCDTAETCLGTSAVCPVDALEPTTKICRVSTEACDTEEKCSGNAVSCPVDVNACTQGPCAGKQAGFVCRASAGPCDREEICGTSQTVCPPDALLAGTTVCRPSAGVCDTAETCLGTSAVCPVDALEPTTKICRVSTEACDTEEKCSGNAVSCPVDVNSCSESSSSSSTVTVKRKYWCCQWDANQKATVYPIIIEKQAPSWIPTFFLSTSDINSCEGGKVIIGKEQEGWTDARALALCEKGAKNAPPAGTAVSAAAAPPSEGIASAPTAEKACTTSVLQTITSGIQSFLSLMSFGVIEKPVPCIP